MNAPAQNIYIDSVVLYIQNIHIYIYFSQKTSSLSFQENPFSVLRNSSFSIQKDFQT